MSKLWTNKNVSNEEFQNIVLFLATEIKSVQTKGKTAVESHHSALIRQKILKSREKVENTQALKMFVHCGSCSCSNTRAPFVPLLHFSLTAA